MTDTFFRRAFAALTDHEPFPWQERLFERLVECDIPPACDIPTGLGKTAVMATWLLALVARLQRGGVLAGAASEPWYPRRLAYVVNRRTIVDQATADAVKLLERVTTGSGLLADIRATLAALVGLDEAPFAVRTLRGALADDGEWRHDPARPAIIVGTVDMIGSKLLFSGYGSSYRMRPREAGLLGQDILFIHDEAHLTSRFGDLLWAVRDEQVTAGCDPRPLHVMELTATQRGTARGEPVVLSDDDLRNTEVLRRFRAKKRLTIERVDDVTTRLAERALARGRETPARIVVFVRSPTDARKIERLIGRDRGAADRTLLLTGTLRGHERDQLASSETFRAFEAAADRPQPERSWYLVATSAGEVGVNIDADHAVCDLTTLDGMIQRLGRVNRLGRGDARIEVLCNDPAKRGRGRRDPAADAPPPDSPLDRTEAALRSLPRVDEALDASPEALRTIADRTDAFATEPRAVPVTDIHLDRWSMTSVTGDMPGREPVAPFLHGISEREPPETHVAWRGELDFLLDDRTELQRFGDRAPLLARELLRDTSRNVAEALLEIGARCSGLRVAFVEHGAWVPRALSEIIGTRTGDAARRRLEDEIAWTTLVLPAFVGGLSVAGTLDAAATEPALDVADEPPRLDAPKSAWRRLRLFLRRMEDDAWVAEPVAGAGERPEVRDLLEGWSVQEGSSEGFIERIERDLGCVAECRVVLSEDEGETEKLLVLFLRKGRDLVDVSSTGAAWAQPLAFHLGRAERHARDIANRCQVGEIADAMATAALWHDRGKDRASWQRAIGNKAGAEPLAKTAHGRFATAHCAGYRHELGSLHDAFADQALMARQDVDLVLHLIASHHGRARPHFAPEAFDLTRTTAENERLAGAVVDRFAALQRQYGRWGLAWLEALLHAADVAASVEPPEVAP